MSSAMEFPCGRSMKCHNVVKRLHGAAMGLNSGTEQLLIIKFQSSRLLRVVAQYVLLALVVFSLPLIGLSNLNLNSDSLQFASEADVKQLSTLFNDLKNEGLLKMGDRALLVSSGNKDVEIYNAQILSDNEKVLVSFSDTERQSSIHDDTFDFAFAKSFGSAAEFIDRTLKVGGIATVQLISSVPLADFLKPSNYKIIYFRQFDSTVIAMQKTAHREVKSRVIRRRLFGLKSEDQKKAALTKLENVLLEPPRAASRRSGRYLKRTRYLPDLMGDSLESYPRRVFIDVGLPGRNGLSDSAWFSKNYPTRNTKFEMYKVETVADQEASGKEVAQIGMPEWLRENVKEEEYVVMKAEAEVVEEIVKSDAIKLVDELFMECKAQGVGGKMITYRSRRAYWECLALYGRLRDEGVAVHQWWG